MSSDTATIVYSYFFVLIATFAGLGYVAKHYIQKHTEDMSDKLDRIIYTLYNDGKTGLVNKVDSLLEHQQNIKIDVEILKAKSELKTTRSRSVK